MSKLFSITGGNCNNTSFSGGQTYQFDFAYRTKVNNTSFLRVDGGQGSFSNIVPDILPTDCTLEKMVVNNALGETDAFRAEVFVNGVFSYGLNKTAGNESVIQIGSMPSYSANDEISVRVTNFSTPINQPKVALYFVETL